MKFWTLTLFFLIIVAAGIFFSVKEAFWPSEANIVSTQSWHSNKFNNRLGNELSGIIGPGQQEVVIPSDWFIQGPLPTEFDGPYWPQGFTSPDYIYPGGSRYLQRQDMPSIIYSL